MVRHAGRKTAVAALALFVVNVYVTFRLFRMEYTHNLESIEGAYIGLARYIRGHFHDLSWFPAWYGGIPFQDGYPPLLHMVVAALAAAGVSPGLAYHAVTAAIYALAPAALFWLVWRLGASRTAAFVAGLLYSLLSPTCWLVRGLRADAGDWFGPLRLRMLVRYGEGPHMASLVLLPLAIGLLHMALQKRRPVHYVAAALAMAAVALSNWIGAFALALALLCYLLAGFGGKGPRAWLTAVAMGCGAYAVAMPWIPPSTIATIRANAPYVGGNFEFNPPLTATFLAGLLLLAWIMAWRRVAPGARFGALFLYATTVITMAGYWADVALVPQPRRYNTEMDLAFWLAAGLAGGLAAGYVSRVFGAQARNRIRVALASLLVLACPFLMVHQHRLGQWMIQPIDMNSTIEARSSRWFGEHMPGRRVFVPGSIGFWMNAFSDTPMLNGGFDNGERNTLLKHVIFQIYFGDRQQVALDWLRAFGCDAVEAGGDGSAEYYHPYRHPEKFRGLPELWREGSDVIYAVPRARASLAHALRATDVVRETPVPYDTALLRPYLAALDDPALPPAAFRWKGASAAEITADLRPEHLLSVQITWDKGWTARVNGQPRRAWGDKLGQMLVEPRCSGPCTVELIYDGGTEMRAARWVSGLALGGGALWILPGLVWRRRRSGPAKSN